MRVDEDRLNVFSLVTFLAVEVVVLTGVKYQPALNTTTGRKGPKPLIP